MTTRLDWLAGELLRLGVVDQPLTLPYPPGLTELLRDIDIQIAERDQLTLGDVQVVADQRRERDRVRSKRTHQPTQGERLLAYVKEHPDCTSLDIVRDLNILNHTARVSELRKAGVIIEVSRDAKRSDVFRYRIRES